MLSEKTRGSKLRTEEWSWCKDNHEVENLEEMKRKTDEYDVLEASGREGFRRMALSMVSKT